MRRSVFTMIFAVVFAVINITLVFGGNLDAPAGGYPNVSGAPGAMYTLEDIYNRLLNGTAGTKRGESFVKPVMSPATTGHTLDDIMGKSPTADNTTGAMPADVADGKTFWGLNTGKWGLQIGTGSVATIPAPLSKTGQTICWDPSGNLIGCTGTGQDGAFQKGVASPTPRFTDNGNGTVTDNLTGLIWLKNANCWGMIDWTTAMTNVNAMTNGSCSLTDGSTAGQWRLPNRFELESLLDLSRANPALPAGYPFSNIQTYHYWSSTNQTTSAWTINMNEGYTGYNSKTATNYVWPVRGGQ